MSRVYERFRKFHSGNPHVYELFKRFAREVKSKGRRAVFGARVIWERMRWYAAIETNDDSFKLNDNYIAYYARLLMLDEPEEFSGFFRLRVAGVTDETMRRDLLQEAA